MPRDLPLSNGHLLVTFDSTYTLSDIYFPHVGTENHAYRGIPSSACGRAASSPGCTTPVGNARCATRRMPRDQRRGDETNACSIALDDRRRRRLRAGRADPALHRAQHRHGRRSMCGSFCTWTSRLGGNTVGDTVFFHPDHQAIVAYKNVHYLLLGGRTAGESGSTAGAPRESTTAELAGRRGRRARGAPIAFGSVDCVGELRLGEVADRPPDGRPRLARRRLESRGGRRAASACAGESGPTR